MKASKLCDKILELVSVVGDKEIGLEIEWAGDENSSFLGAGEILLSDRELQVVYNAGQDKIVITEEPSEEDSDEQGV